MLVNTNDIRSLTIEKSYTEKWDIILTMDGGEKRVLSTHAAENQAEEVLDKIEYLLKKAGCLIDMCA